MAYSFDIAESRPPIRLGATRSAGCGNIEFDFAQHLDDGFGMTAILEERVFERLGAVRE